MSKEIKELNKSIDFAKNDAKRTSMGLAGGTVGGTTVYGILKTIRGISPDILPWDVSADEAVSIVIGVVLIPAISSIRAYFEHKSGSTTTQTN